MYEHSGKNFMHMHVRELYKLGVRQHMACELGEAITHASGTVIKKACFLMLHWR